MPFATSFRPVDLISKFTVPWSVRESASFNQLGTNPSQPPLNAASPPAQPLFNLLSPLSNSARAIEISQYESQKESGYEWLFNYKAVLNTRVQTIQTKLTNSLSADLEGIFGRYPGGLRVIQRQPSGIYVYEPAPSADEWGWLYGADLRVSDPANNTSYTTTGATNVGPAWEKSNNNASPPTAPNGTDPATPADGQSVVLKRGVTTTASLLTVRGTPVIVSGGTIAGTTGTDKTVQFHDGGSAGVATSRFWSTYLELFNNAEFTDTWRYGLLDKIIIAATAATGNGSQLQSSIQIRNPDILKMSTDTSTAALAQSTKLKPGSLYPGQLSGEGNPPGANNLVQLGGAASGGSATNSSPGYVTNYGTNVSTPGNITDAHGFIQTKFTAFWHS